MVSVTRRQVMRGTGLVLGGLAVSGTVLAESSDRFLVDTRHVGEKGALERAGVEIIHDLSQIELAVVHGRASQVKTVTRDFVPDIAFEAQLPVRHHAAAEDTTTGDATDAEYWNFQWDKQVQNIPAVHEITRGADTRVAVLDTGVDPLHPDLEHAVNTDLSKNFTPNGGDFWDIDYHGTNVSGIIAADGGIVGTAPETDLLALRVFQWGDFDDEPGLDLLASHGDIIAAMVYAASHGCDVINMSLGSYEQMRDARGEYGRVWNQANTYVNRQGTLVVASAGNSAINIDRDRDGQHSPSGTAQVMSVSATGPIGYLYDAGEDEQPAWGPAFYTNYGMSGVDIGAPGGNLLIPPPEDVGFYTWLADLVLCTAPRWGPYDVKYYWWDGGTSMAAPQVTGAAALLASLDTGPRRSRAGRIESTLTETATTPEGYDKAYYGSGFIDPLAAVNAVT